jgi:ATP-dependent Clp protease protease subunit
MAKATEEMSHTRLKDRIDEALLKSRRLFICDGIDNGLAEETIKKLWFLEIENPGKPILLIINSPGGSVDAGFAIWDQIKMITSPVTTLVTGMAASMASILMLAAPEGKRFATPRSRVMIHQPAVAGVIQGQATDLEIQAKEILKTKKMIIELYVQATGKPYDAIEKSIDRDTWMTPEEAKQFGLVDKIVSSYKDIEHVSK